MTFANDKPVPPYPIITKSPLGDDYIFYYVYSKDGILQDVNNIVDPAFTVLGAFTLKDFTLPPTALNIEQFLRFREGIASTTLTKLYNRTYSDTSFDDRDLVDISNVGVGHSTDWAFALRIVDPPPDPIQPDPIQPDPIQPDPIQPDPVQPDPVQPDPVQPDPVQPDPVQPDPVQPDPIQPDPQPDDYDDYDDDDNYEDDELEPPPEYIYEIRGVGAVPYNPEWAGTIWVSYDHDEIMYTDGVEAFPDPTPGVTKSGYKVWKMDGTTGYANKYYVTKPVRRH